MKKTGFFFFILLLLMVSCQEKREFTISLVPEPVELIKGDDYFTMDKKSKIVFLNADLSDPRIGYIQEQFPRFFGFSPKIKEKGGYSGKSIIFEINQNENEALGTEGYEMKISKKNIVIKANNSAGLFYGFQTLVQLAPADLSVNPQKEVYFPSVQITDYPRFEWRGSHRDVSRHFFDIDHLKKHLDLMALYKLNKFHWHLTDDHGWRLEIEKYPLLTEIGAWRVDRNDKPWRGRERPKKDEPRTYGGFYTKEEVRDIIAYAQARNIDVIPEIEIPGHCSEILASYPQFACDDYPYEVEIGPYWPPKAILCAGNDEVMVFLKEVLDEVAALFPYEYIHIGGDEAVKTNWEKCPKCQKRIKDLDLKDEENLQSWMILEAEKWLEMDGKKIIGWDEILMGGVSENATIMSWQGDAGGIAAAQKGNYAIMCPTSHCYFDYYQYEPKEEPIAICCYIPLEKVYAFNPVPDMLTAEEAKFIKGGQGNLWAEFIPTPEHAEYMLLPRLCALAESVWTPLDKKEWDAFIARLDDQKKRLKSLGYNYCDKIGLIKK